MRILEAILVTVAVSFEVDVIHFADMVTAYGECGTRSQLLQRSRFAGMLGAQHRIIDRAEWTHGPSTLMAVLGLQRAEVANCRAIRWLLDPLSPHGLGAEMVRALGVALDIDLPDPARARIKAEVSRGDSRADVVVTGLSWTLVIEAKVDAAEGRIQAARIEQHWPEARSLVFLTRSGRQLPGTANDPARWASISWLWFADTAERLLGGTTARTVAGEHARHALAEWISATRSHLG